MGLIFIFTAQGLLWQGAKIVKEFEANEKKRMKKKKNQKANVNIDTMNERLLTDNEANEVRIDETPNI